MMDANKNVVEGDLTRRLAEDSIALQEAVHLVTTGQGPKTWIRGHVPIDSIWHTPDLT